VIVRVIYEIRDDVLVVLVIRIGHRREATVSAERRPSSASGQRG